MTYRRLAKTSLAAAMCLAAIGVEAEPRRDVNFAFGGATTHAANATDAFAAQDPLLAALVAEIRAQGLDLIGMEQQLDFATATLNDVDSETDVFWVYGGINNYLAGEQNPTVAPQELVTALGRLHAELGASRFVVPNLPAMGDLPLFASFPAPVRDLLTLLTAIHNQVLAGALAQFAATTPGVQVESVDVFNIFQGHKVSGQFSNTTDACNEVLPPAQLPVPGACDGFLYLDNVHPSSAAWTPVAAAAAGVIGADVDRVISIGDSFSDAGAMSDTFLRTVGFPFPFPPFTEGRFTEGDNVVQQLEELLATGTRTSFFAQPHSASQTLAATGPGDAGGTVFVPKQLAGDSAARGVVKLRFNKDTAAEVQCKYAYAGEGLFLLDKCGGGLVGGDRVPSPSVQVKLARDVDEVTIDWLFYP